MDKRTLNRILLGWILLLIIVALIGKVSVAAPNGGQTSADFLNIGLGARPAGMGGAYSAVGEGAGAAYWNPAGLKSVQSGEVTLGHFAWYQDITYEQGVFAHKVNERSSFAATVGYLNYGDIDGRDAAGLSTGNVSVYDWYGAVSWGYSVSPEFSVGVTGKFVAEKLDDISASTFAADIGFLWHLDRITVAAVASNIGPDMDYEGYSEHLPSAARIGLAVRPWGENILTAIDLEKSFYGDVVLRNGLEYGYLNQYFVRAGYSFYPEADNRSFGSGLSVGAGVRFEQFDFDYAYTLKEDYASDELHRFSVSLRFGR